MCGICGVIGKGIEIKDLDAIQDLMWVNGLRGPHSTGLFTHTAGGAFKKQKYRIEKTLGTSAYFLSKDGIKKSDESMFRTVYSEVFMAHSRWATKGAISLDNAHPFDTGRYVSAHNGTLKDNKYQDKHRTDSEMLFRDMEVRGIAPVLNDLDSDAAFAVSIFDKKENVLTLGRNSERPLSVGISKKRNVLWWASELAALQFISTRRNLGLEFFDLVPDTLYHIDVEKVRQGDFTPWEVTELTPKTKVVSKYVWPDVTAYSDIFDQEPSTSGKTRQDILDEQCCICTKFLYGRFLEEAECIEVSGSKYYSCKECSEETEKRTKRMGM